MRVKERKPFVDAPQGITSENHAFREWYLENARAFYGGELTRGNA